jgi:hypothetical protein
MPNYLNKSRPFTRHTNTEVISVDGQRFPFTRGSAKSRAEAVAKAEAASEKHLAVMEKQKGAPLSKMEQVSGKFDTPPEPSVPRSLKTEKKEPDNIYADVAAEIADTFAPTPAERAQKENRLAHFQALAAKREQQRVESQVAAEREQSPEVKRMRDHASATYEALKRDPKATPQAIRDAERRLKLANDTLQPGSYWTLVRESLGTEPPAQDVGIETDVAARLAEQTARNLYERQSQ